MLPSFTNLLEFNAMFATDMACRHYLEDMIWKGNPTCPHCGKNKPYKLSNGKTYRCSNKECKKDFTITVGTVFEGTNVPLSKWFLAIYIMTNHKKGLSSVQLGKNIGVTQRTAWFILHRIREMVKPTAPVMLKEHVMVDECYMGGKEKNKSNKKRRETAMEKRTNDKIPVFGMVEMDGLAILKVVPDAKGETLKPIIIQQVDEDSVIVTDGGVVYESLENDFTGGHQVANHSKGEYVNQQGFTTNHIESVFALLKRTIYGTYHYVSGKHLQRYCVMCSYRYNTRRMHDSSRFIATVTNAAGRLKYKDLIAKK